MVQAFYKLLSKQTHGFNNLFFGEPYMYENDKNINFGHMFSKD